jgi:dTDP-4-amino-4,6-dideoxygalactose transaminase
MSFATKKTHINDLAILGGVKLFDEAKHVGRPNVGDRQNFLRRVNNILDSRWLTNDGPNVKELEGKIANFLGVKHCIATSNGTLALMLLIKAIGLKGEVIVPSFTFIATAHALQWQDVTPVFCDIDPQSFTIDPHEVESLITERTTGILGVHLWGIPCHIQSLTDIAKKYNLKLIFDAAHAFGVTSRGKMIGAFGDAEIFSFHATKFFHTLEGGAIVTKNDDLAVQIRLMRNFGFHGADNVISLGINGKMNEIAGAMGLTMLEDLNRIVDCNKRNYETYKKELHDIKGVSLLEFNEKEKNNFQYIVIVVDEKKAKIERDQMVAILNAENILARRYFYPGCHKMEPYSSMPWYKEISLPATDSIARQVACLPSGTAISIQDIIQICEIIRYVCNNGSEIQHSCFQ